MDKYAEALAKLIVILECKGVLDEKDKDFICGEITIEEWNDKEG